MEFLPFFLVLLAAVFFSEVFQRLHLPWVVALILGGMIIGPWPGLGWEPSESIEFLGQIGLIFLMFMAGLETRLSGFAKIWQSVTLLSVLNSALPFMAGYGIGWIFGLGMAGSILLGIIFVSSAIAVVIPVLESNKLLGTAAGRLITPAAVFQDIFSLVMLAVFLQIVEPTREGLPVFLFLLLAAVSVVLLRLIVPKVEWLLSLNVEQEGFEQNLRSLLVILLGSVVIFELLGLHPIVGGFFAGLIISDSLINERLKQKIHTISYGLFIPVFFVVVGASTDLTVFQEVGEMLWLVLAVVLGSMLTKFVSGFAGARMSGFPKLDSLLVGVATMPQLSITLAVAFTGVELGLFGELGHEVTTALVALTIVTTLLTPMFIRAIAKRMDVKVV